MAMERLGPITGHFPAKGMLEDPDEIPAHVGFDNAWKDALDQAADSDEWRKAQPLDVRVEYVATIKIWNPGGIGHYSVIITPGG
jgi:hypothetical protein